MSHLIVEIPKSSPQEGFWIDIVVENWVLQDILYLPDNSYSAAYKHNLLVGGGHPDVKT